MGTQLCMVILKRKGELQQQKFDFLLRGPRVPGVENPLPEWVSDTVWSAVQALRVSTGSPQGIFQDDHSCLHVPFLVTWDGLSIQVQTSRVVHLLTPSASHPAVLLHISVGRKHMIQRTLGHIEQ